MSTDGPAITEVEVVDGAWRAVLTHGGRRVTVHSDLEPAWGDEAAAREMFAHTARKVAERQAEVVAAATRALLPTYNDAWRAPDAAPLSAVAFARRLVLDCLRTTDPSNPARLITLYFVCGELFADHLIEVALEWDGSPLGKPHLIG